MPNPIYDRLFAPLAGMGEPFLTLVDGPTFTGIEFLAMVHCAAGALRAHGISAGDRVAVQVAKTPQALAVYGAIVAVGAVFLPLNTAYTAAEVDYFVGDAAPALLLVDPACAEALAPIAAAHGAKLLTLDANGHGTIRDLCDAQSDLFAVEDRDDNDLAALLYTSGTTGRSKGAMLTHGNLLSNAEALAREWRFTSADVLLHAVLEVAGVVR